MRISRRAFVKRSAGVGGVLAYGLTARPARCDEVEWLAEVQQPPANLTPLDRPLAPLLVDASGQSITTMAEWEKRRPELRSAWTKVLGQLEVSRPTPTLTVLEQDVTAGVRRSFVRYESEPGLPVEGYLLQPMNLADPVPGFVVLHSTVPYTIRQPAGLEGPEEKFFGLDLARKGYVAFCPRCFLWQGDGKYDELVDRFQKRHPGVTGMAKMLFDAQRAVDVLESLPVVDPSRIGAIGHSLGAKEALYLLAFDDRVKVAVSSEGGVGIAQSNWNAPWYLGKQVDEPNFPREHHELAALCAPRALLVVGGESADGDRSWSYLQPVLDVYKLYGSTNRLGLYNHRRGHAVPPAARVKMFDWLDTYV